MNGETGAWLGKAILLVFFFWVVSYCSSSTQEARLKAENKRLEEANSRLQADLTGREPARADAGENTQDNTSSPAPKQTLEDGALSIRVGNGQAAAEYCTKIDYDNQTLFSACSPSPSHYTLLNKEKYGKPVFREEWVRLSGNGLDESRGLTLWSIEDDEMVELISLPVQVLISSCHAEEDGCKPSERWLRATFNLQDDVAQPSIRYQYLTESGESGEFNYQWSDGRFNKTDKTEAEVVMMRYGF